jgi:hypothetical protein
MKNILIISLVLLIVSCSKDDDTSVVPGTSVLSMKINGTQWSGNIIGNMVDETTDNLVVQSFNTSPESFGFTIEDFTGVGDYPTSQGSNFTGALFSRKDKVIFSGGGTDIKYKVTSIEGSGTSKKGHGTFSGIMKSSAGEVLTITEGKF